MVGILYFVAGSRQQPLAICGFVSLKWDWHNWELIFEFRGNQPHMAQAPALDREFGELEDVLICVFIHSYFLWVLALPTSVTAILCPFVWAIPWVVISDLSTFPASPLGQPLHCTGELFHGRRQFGTVRKDLFLNPWCPIHLSFMFSFWQHKYSLSRAIEPFKKWKIEVIFFPYWYYNPKLLMPLKLLRGLNLLSWDCRIFLYSERIRQSNVYKQRCQKNW